MSEVAIDQAEHVRSVVIALDEISLLLPTAVVLEVVAYQEPQSVEGAPPWFLGSVRWRMSAVPLVSMQAAIGMAPEDIRPGARIVICSTLNGNPDLPFVGIQATAIPHLARLDKESMNSREFNDENGFIHCEIQTEVEKVLLPDLDALENALKPYLG